MSAKESGGGSILSTNSISKSVHGNFSQFSDSLPRVIMRYIYAYTPAELQYLQQRHRFGNEIRLSPFAYASEERSYLDVHFSALRLKNLSITIEEALCRSTHDWINTWYNIY